MRIWKVKASLFFVCEEDGRAVGIVGKYVFGIDIVKEVVFHHYKTCYKTKMAFEYGFLLFRSLGMSQENKRWNPKPCLCFQRIGFGTLIVLGKEIIQLDEEFKFKRKHTFATFYHACQQAMLMIGALDMTGETI